MSQEGQLFDRKSLRAVTGKTTDWAEIAKDCVAFANASGGRLLLGNAMTWLSDNPGHIGGGWAVQSTKATANFQPNQPLLSTSGGHDGAIDQPEPPSAQGLA